MKIWFSSKTLNVNSRLIPAAFGMVCAFLGYPCRAQNPSPQQVDAIFAEFDQPGSVGCALGVARAGEFLYKKGYGYANLDWDIPITPTAVFYVGSVSKQFTAATIALLEHEGLLSLDDNIRKFLPEMPDYQPPVTIRHLLHHTSGVPDMYRVMSENGLSTWDRFSREQALELLAQQELDFPAGERYQYSNGGYFALSMIVARASGKTLAEYAHEKIFEPLGMNDTHFHDDPVQIVQRRAMSYMPREDREGGYFQSYQGNFALPGAGGLYTTVEDLLLWDRNFLENGLGGPDFLDVMHTKGVLNNGEVLDYALAIQEGAHRGLRTLGHTGSFMGFKAYYVRYPEQRFSTWVLCNMGEIVPAELGSRVAELYLTDLMEPESGR
jgi:CubicO group peptidase (beta-lactamase class C family)